jgi:hypothetical protein
VWAGPDAQRHMTEFLQAYEHGVRGSGVDRRRVSRARLERVAALYERAPVGTKQQAVADAEGVSRGYAGRLIMEARGEGLLPKLPPRKKEER